MTTPRRAALLLTLVAGLGAATAMRPPAPAGGAPLPGRVLFRGDFESGSLGQWAGYQAVARNRIRVVRSPRAQGRYAARFEVRNGDNPIGYGDRAEVQAWSTEHEGEERLYDWRIRFAPGFPRSPGWQVVTQWHSALDGVPPVALYVSGDEVYLQVYAHDARGRPVRSAAIPWRGPLMRGRWQRFRLHVRWSGSDRRGFLRLWVNGRPATGLVRGRTLYPGQPNFLKLGYYRQSGIRRPGVVYHDGMTVTAVR